MQKTVHLPNWVEGVVRPDKLAREAQYEGGDRESCRAAPVPLPEAEVSHGEQGATGEEGEEEDDQQILVPVRMVISHGAVDDMTLTQVGRPAARVATMTWASPHRVGPSRARQRSRTLASVRSRSR